MQAASQNRNFAGFAFWHIGEALPNLLHMGIGLWAKRRDKTLSGFHAAQSVIGGASQRNDIEIAFHEPDGRDKQARG